MSEISPEMDSPTSEMRPAVYYLEARAAQWGGWGRLWALVRFLAVRQMTTRYRGSATGIVWSLINPVLMMIVYTFVFKYLMKAQTPGVPYPIYFLTGVLAWNFFAQGVTSAAASVAEQRYLYSKAWFPRIAMPLGAVLGNGVVFAISLPVLLILVIASGVHLTANLLLLPLSLALLAACTVGIGLILAALAPFMRDILQLLDVLIQVWFFATPVVYTFALPSHALSTRAGGWFLELYQLNPMVGIIELIHATFLGWDVPLHAAVYAVVVSLGLLAGGLWVFWKLEPKFSDAA